VRTCDVHVPFQPASLAVLQGPHFLLSGGLQIDGSEIAPIVAAQLENACDEIDRQVQKTMMRVSLPLRSSAGYPRSRHIFRVRPHRL